MVEDALPGNFNAIINDDNDEILQIDVMICKSSQHTLKPQHTPKPNTHAN